MATMTINLVVTITDGAFQTDSFNPPATATTISGLHMRRVLTLAANTFTTLDTGDLSLLGFAVIKTSSSVTCRTGATPGSGSAKVQKWNGTSLSDGAGTITVRTIAAGGHATGKYGYAAKLFGSWWILSLEC